MDGVKSYRNQKFIIWCEGEEHYMVYSYDKKRFFSPTHNIENELAAYEIFDKVEMCDCAKIASRFLSDPLPVDLAYTKKRFMLSFWYRSLKEENISLDGVAVNFTSYDVLIAQEDIWLIQPAKNYNAEAPRNWTNHFIDPGSILGDMKIKLMDALVLTSQ